MAEPTTGIQPSGGGGAAAGGPKAKQKKMLMFGGIGIAVLLLLSHKGSGGPSGQSGAQGGGLLDAYQQGVQDAANVGGLNTGSTGVGSSGGGGDTSGSGSMPTNGSTPTDPGTQQPAPPPAVGPINIYATPPPSKPKGHGKSKKHSSTHSVQHHEHKDKVHPSSHHPSRPGPADHDGHHHDSRHVTRHGKRRRSPIVLEAMDGAGHGVTVMGRDFPGATGHRLGAPRGIPGGGVARDVAIFYGGHTDVHTVSGGGEWMDNTRGRNPLGARPLAGS